MMKTNKERYNLERDTVMCSNPRAMFPMGSMNSCEMQQKDCGVLGGEDELGDCVCYSVDAKGNKELSYIEILPAYHGDAFIIHAFREEFSGIIVIDGGPDQSRIKVLRALEQLEKIDLMVLTHNDSDHISGLNTYLEQQTELDSNNVEELWVNCAREIDIRVGNIVSYSQASKLADMLRLLNEKKHPDREALANILCHPRRDKGKVIRLYFNYDIEDIQKRTGLLLTEDEIKTYNCELDSPVSKFPI